MFNPFSKEEKEHIEKEYDKLFKINDLNEELKEKYRMLLQNIYNFNKYVKFEENCKIINAINKLEEVGSHIKTIVLKSDMSNIKEGMILDIYILNELYIKDYQENKDNREIEVSHNGIRTIVNPFKNVEILIIIEKDNNITFVDKFDFCSRTELKPNFYEALKYHYVPGVIKDIEKAIKADNEKYEIYQFEVGILLQEDDEAYKNVWDFKHSYYNENWGFAKTYEEAKDYVDTHIGNGCNNSYGIISKLEVTYAEYKSIYNGWSDSIDLDYDLNNIVYNAYKKDDTIIENFIDLNYTNKLCSKEQCVQEDYSKDTIYKIETNIPGTAKIELVRVLTQVLNLITVESIKDGYVFTYEKNFFNENAKLATEEDIKNYEFELNEDESEVL